MEAAARRMEMDLPELGSDLINVVQLSDAGGDRQSASAGAETPPAGRVPPATPCRHGVSPGRGERGGRPPGRRARSSGPRPEQSRWRRLAVRMQTPRDLAESLLVLAMLIAAAMLCDRWMPNLALGRQPAPLAMGVRPFGRLGRNHGRHARATSRCCPARVSKSPPQVRRSGRAPPAAVLVLVGEDGRQSAQAMACSTGFQPVKGHGQMAGLRRANNTAKTAVLRATTPRSPSSCGRCATGWKLAIRRRRSIPSASARGRLVEGVEVTYRYPAYLGRQPETIVQQRDWTWKRPNTRWPS